MTGLGMVRFYKAVGIAVFLAWLPSITAAAERPQVAQVPASTETRPFAFARIVSGIKAGQFVGTYSDSPVCFPVQEKVYWNDKVVNLNSSGFAGTFEEKAKAAGFKVSSARDDLFQEGSTGDFEVAALITGLDFKICQILEWYRGDIRMDIEWQVYSKLERKVVAKIPTSARFEEKTPRSMESGKFIDLAFADNVTALLNSGDFRKIVFGRARKEGDVVTADASPTRIQISPAKVNQVGISDAVGSVVTVVTRNGHGSGALISADGYVVTNAHVVGDERTVKIRWSDGFETTGTIVKSQRPRDVALIKTDPHGRAPLPLNAVQLPPGSPVYAIGAPIDEKLAGTVTKGIVSANRILDGFSFIQADVTVNPGNSGGPLLNEQGNVVGLTVAQLRTDGPTGLNLFIPIRDVIDFLALDVK